MSEPCPNPDFFFNKIHSPPPVCSLLQRPNSASSPRLDMMRMDSDPADRNDQQENSEKILFGGSSGGVTSKTRTADGASGGSGDVSISSASTSIGRGGGRGHPMREAFVGGDDAAAGDVSRMPAPAPCSSTSLRRKSTAMHGGGAAMSELSRIPEGEHSEEQSALLSVSSSVHPSSVSPRVSSSGVGGGGPLSGSSHGYEGVGYASSRAGWLRPRTPGAATASGYINMETPRTTLGTPGADWRGVVGGDGGGMTGDGMPNPSQPHGSWGGCSTIKRRGDDAEGSRVSGLLRPGDDGDDEESVILDRSRRSSSTADSSLASSIGGEVGVRKTPRAGRGQGGVGGRGGGGGEGGGGGRSSAGGGGRVDYHSLCFSSSSSNYSSSPFGLLDGDSPSTG